MSYVHPDGCPGAFPPERIFIITIYRKYRKQLWKNTFYHGLRIRYEQFKRGRHDSPLHIRFGEEEYADGVTISHKEFYEKLIECDTLPTTSLVSPAVFEEAYEKAVSAGETVIVVTISSKLSGTCQSARIAAEDYEGKVFVVDSLNATIGEQILVEYGLQLKKQGMTAKRS